MFSWLKNLFSTKYEVSLNIVDPVKMDEPQIDTLPCDTELCEEDFMRDVMDDLGNLNLAMTYDPEPVKPKRTRKKSTAKKLAIKKSTKSPRTKKSTKK